MAAKEDVSTTRLTPASARRAEQAKRALARRHDQLVLVLRHGRRKRRGDVEHVVASGHRFRPSGVLLQIGRGEGQAIHRARPTALRQHRLDVALPREIAHSGPHVVSSLEKLENAVAADEASAARNQNLSHAIAEPLLLYRIVYLITVKITRGR